MDDELERINRNLEVARATNDCLACGSKDLILDPSARTALLGAHDREVQLDRAIEAVAVICKRCGFVRLHSTRHLFEDN